MRILLLHAYSAHNRGDGLLVDESVALIRSVFDDVELEVVASDPDSFSYVGVPVYNAKPGRRGWSREYLRVLRNLDSYDLLVGVGGGYLRAGKPVEMLKCLLVMGPQIFAAGRSSTRSVYLPQSIGPFRFGSIHLFRALVKRIGVYMLRDDRSMQEIALANCVRLPDLAISSPEFTDSLSSSDSSVDDTVIFTTRAVGGALPPRVKELGRLLHAANIPVVGYVQSAIGGNNDTEVQRELTGDNPISSEEYLRRAIIPGAWWWLCACTLHSWP
ncbi:polysaccharide pyruvyl transferase family protein [Corynebacterium durum]|uniref:polysaccharide pyruvyl transferase family protein n=1 Tax=Corynebacterium durum TaxID=61592 RepID=UPI002357EF01|nr:polysaccharide pyruvyl transferase family protein [Corynebacterium durum]